MGDRPVPTGYRRLGSIVVVIAVLISLSVTWYVTQHRTSTVDDPPETVTSTQHDRPSDASPAPSTVAPTMPAPRPAEATLHLSSRYANHYRARYATWSDLLDQGRSLPVVSQRCADRWRDSAKDPRLDWTSVEFLCLDALGGHGFTPQGIAGSATTQNYAIGSRPAATRNIVVTSWYSRQNVPGVFAPNRTGESVTRLVVMDMDRRRYNTIELVKPDGPETLRNLNSHGSGLAWTGQYLYSSSHANLWMYNADDLLNVSGRFVLPAVSRWTAHGAGGFSSISLDRTATPTQLKSINFSHTEHAYIHSFALARSGLLAPNHTGAAHDLIIKNTFGEPGRVLHSTASVAISGSHYQGVASTGRYTFANSSRLSTPRSEPDKVDAVTVMKGDRLVGYVHMPEGNGESVYIDDRRHTYLSLVEQGGQFLYAIPVSRLIHAAGMT